MSTLVCTDCGTRMPLFDVSGASIACPDCGGTLTQQTLSAPTDSLSATGAAQPLAPTEKGAYPFTFTGNASEYFRIWIVNTFLTIVTFGIYAAWAKVRNRQYLYANTQLAGHSFSYLANPISILRGNLILAGGLAVYTLTDMYFTLLSGVIVLIFYLVLPWLLYKTLRFKAHNSAWRNIRFRFLGDLGDSYLVYLLFPIALPFTLGLLIPYWDLAKRRYFFNNMAFGKTRNRFEGKAGPFYMAYLLAILAAIGLGLILFLPAGYIIGETGLGKALDPANTPELFFAVFFVVFLLMQLLFTSIQQIIYARTMNHCWQNSALGEIRFESTLHGGRLMWIRLTNILAILGSLGLLAPWATIRRTRYMLSCLTMTTDSDLDALTAATEQDDNALGDVAADAFDFEVGL